MAHEAQMLRRVREARGITQSELARRAGISRQALGAIEAGVYQPSVVVALALAHELGATVEGLFGRTEEDDRRRVAARFIGGKGLHSGVAQSRVTLARVGGRMIAVAQPAVRLALASAAGTIQRTARATAEVVTYRSRDEIDSTLLIAGCDPAAAMLADWLARHRSPIAAVALASSSAAALDEVLAGRAHAAGVHMRDPKSGEYNLAWVRKALGRREAMIVNFARWELGLTTAAANRLNIRGCADLARPGIRIVNREAGAGARSALDEALADLGLAGERIEGYDREVAGHLEVAAAVATGQADAGVTIGIAAAAYGLAFMPFREERYDLVILERERDSAPVKAMLEALNFRRFAREISQLCMYDTDQMGKVIAQTP
jgi:molybdate-binding protein/DNA-binding XRE family transcriptional regulator